MSKSQRPDKKLGDEPADPRQAAALRHVALAEQAATGAYDLADVSPVPVDAVAVIGAGAMGAGIATCFAAAGTPVVLVDISPEGVERGVTATRRNLDGAVAKGKMSGEERDRAVAMVSGSTSYASAENADLVVEAVFENLALKKKIFADLDRAVKPSAILATNTSYLDVDAIAAGTGRPDKVLGLHFFNPAHVMKLLEIVRARQTSPTTLATGIESAKRLRKTGVVAGVSFGFIGNRMLNAYRTEALNLALEGARIAEIDRVIAGFGMPMGPFALMDLTGLEVNVKMRAEADPRFIDARAFTIVDRLYASGRNGQKAGAGFYLYDHGGRTRTADPGIDAMIAAEAEKHGVRRRDGLAAEEIVDRCLLALVNEGARILEERVAARSGDIDVTYIAGYGFPRSAGGPMYWAEQQGIGAISSRIERYHQRTHAPRWRPAALIERAAQRNLTFDQALAEIRSDQSSR